MDEDAASDYYEALLAGYLEATPATTLDETVARFVAPVRSAFTQEQDAQPAIETMLWAAWQCVIRVAGDSSAAQDRLVDLLTGIKDQGVLTRDQGRQECVLWDDLRVFADLPMFGAQMREAWDIGADPPGSMDVWVNMNAFAARLTAAGIDFSQFAIWTLRDCFGQEPPVGPTDPRAAAPWFEHCGQLMADLANGSAGSASGGVDALQDAFRVLAESAQALPGEVVDDQVTHVGDVGGSL